jgi:hypothetical protein
MIPNFNKYIGCIIMERGRKKENTLCWNCANACGKCCWSKKFKKVKGWIAKKTIIKGDPNGLEPNIDSYLVIECPKFIKDERSLCTLGVTNTIVAKKLGFSCLRTYMRNTTKQQRDDNKQKYIMEMLERRGGCYEL